MVSLLVIAWAYASAGAVAPQSTPATVIAAAQKPAVAVSAASDISYLLGGWDIVAKEPSDGSSARVDYDVRVLNSAAWMTGRGKSAELGLDSSDVWGRDPITGEIMRLVFDSSGTFAIVKSKGWQDGVLVLEGEARSDGGVVRVRETIRRLNDNEFTATWEALRDGKWSPYSIEHATRRPVRS